MHGFWYFLIGAFVGALLGVVLMAMLFMSREREDSIERIKRDWK